MFRVSHNEFILCPPYPGNISNIYTISIHSKIRMTCTVTSFMPTPDKHFTSHVTLDKINCYGLKNLITFFVRSLIKDGGMIVSVTLAYWKYI